MAVCHSHGLSVLTCFISSFVYRFFLTKFPSKKLRVFCGFCLSTEKKQLASRFNLTYRYIDNELCINNPEFEYYLGRMSSFELEIKDTTENITCVSYLDLLLSIWMDCQLYSSIYVKQDDFNFHITNFPFLSSDIPSSPAYHIMAFLFLSLYDTSGLVPHMIFFYLRTRQLSSKLLKQRTFGIVIQKVL